MTRRLKTIAKFINENMPGYSARIERAFCNTDLKVGRLRIPKKGCWGNRLIVEKDGEIVFRHNAAETYRMNSEVEDWLRRELER